MRLPCCHNPFGGSPTATLPHDTKVDKFDGWYYIEEQYHTGEQIYWCKYMNICINWIKHPGLDPHTVEKFFCVE